MLPRWKGWRARRYGPHCYYKIPRASQLFWEIEGRSYFLTLRRPWKNLPRIRKYRESFADPFPLADARLIPD